MTGLISTCGQQFQDWSAAYRLFSRPRLDPQHLFAGLRRAVLDSLPEGEPLCLALDDSLWPKTGTRIPGVAWRRDPLGPRFQTNLIRAQRVLQFSAAVPLPEHPQARRMIPVDFRHSPTPPKPGPKAPAEQRQAYRQACQQAHLGTQALARLGTIQSSLNPAAAAPGRPLHLLVDGRFTNRTVLRPLLPRLTLIGRLRQHAKLYYAPAPIPRRGRGRPRQYGPLAPTPEQLRRDEQVPWEPVTVFAAGSPHQCRVKILSGVLWRAAGAHRPLKVVVIAPLRYRPRQGSKLLYRQPAFLLCTDPALPTPQIVLEYVWRWDIEVNFREEKSLLGVGQAQVRTPASTQAVPALLVASYALLLLAALRGGTVGSRAVLLPPPKWRARRNPLRTSTQQMIHQLQAEVWGRGLGLSLGNFSGFSTPPTPGQKPEKTLPSLTDALLYCNH